MENIIILAIETSCDETSCAIIKNGKEVLSNVISSQIPTHLTTGGVIPEVASRLHTEQITIVIDQAIAKSNLSIKDINAVAVTAGPGLQGALLVGIEAAKAFAFCHDLPLIGVHHIGGHIYATNVEYDLKFPLLSLVVSGGHTELIYMEDHLKFKVLCKTTDDAIGETFDKVARVLKLPYPGGPHIDRLSKLTDETIELKYSYDKTSKSFSYSGLKTAIINYVNSETMKGNAINDEAVCNTFQQLAIAQIVDKTKMYVDSLGVKQLLVAGGVAANSYLRETLNNSLDIEVCVPSIRHCTDNAVMIGCIAYYQYLKNNFVSYDLNANPNLNLEATYNEL